MDAHFARVSGSNKDARLSSDHVPTPAASAITSHGGNFAGFNGMTQADQRLAGGGNQFSLEPPDQGLAVGNGYVVEAVNLAAAVYDTSGALVAGPVDLNSFYGLPPAIIRAPVPQYGPFLSDPRIYYDAATGRWFMTVLEIDTNPATGDLLGHSSVLIAVSQTNSPTNFWNVYSLDTTNNTGGPAHAECPCFGDQPLIGADQYGFYITTNEFSIAGSAFNGAQVYAVSKAQLEAGTASSVSYFPSLPLAEGQAYSVQPATTPGGGSFASANGGTEYFMSALDFFNTLDNRVAVWAMTNTSSLDTATPNPSLTVTVIASQVYGLPPAAQQLNGPLLLADLLKTKNNGLGITTNEHLELVDTDDDRMQQTVYAAGSLWTSLGTVVKTPNGPTRAGVAWFIVTPSWSGGNLQATMTRQGYVAANQESVAYPSIGVNAAGKGVMVFTLTGPDFYPTAAYATLDMIAGSGPIQLAALGAFPDDGFTGYGAFGGRVARWGDYSAAVADSDGSIWMATEYIPYAPRTLLANWGTFIGKIVP
ncbi:MAG TPA: hypothetical protein VG456_28935 [Candidatus Sulfopaludibacter sp.]|nr:hypothetical protein [Candidatus Sulfopaludibacter sp.]